MSNKITPFVGFVYQTPSQNNPSEMLYNYIPLHAQSVFDVLVSVGDVTIHSYVLVTSDIADQIFEQFLESDEAFRLKIKEVFAQVPSLRTTQPYTIAEQYLDIKSDPRYILWHNN